MDSDFWEFGEIWGRFWGDFGEGTGNKVEVTVYHGFAVQCFGGLDFFCLGSGYGFAKPPKAVTALGLGVQCTTSGRVYDKVFEDRVRVSWFRV